ncbi:hypothetical protein [Bacillus sp. 1P02SD]|uniref:hypothetical protein n=1 Tax=Bacillus sp. 1P02SD TaxID=3132264 RepID=UPI00399FD53D
MENYFLDGTKIEANANKYSFVWKKATTKFEEKLRGKIQETLRHIEVMTELEAPDDVQNNTQNSENLSSDLEEIAETLEEKVEKLSEELKNETNAEVIYKAFKVNP